MSSFVALREVTHDERQSVSPVASREASKVVPTEQKEPPADFLVIIQQVEGIRSKAQPHSGVADLTANSRAETERCWSLSVLSDGHPASCMGGRGPHDIKAQDERRRQTSLDSPGRYFDAGPRAGAPSARPPDRGSSIAPQADGALKRPRNHRCEHDDGAAHCVVVLWPLEQSS